MKSSAKPISAKDSNRNSEKNISKYEKQVSKLVSADIDDVINFEKELESAMAILDPTGQYSRTTPPSRGKTPKYSPSEYGILPPISSSRPASRDYGGYKPGKRASVSSSSNDSLSLSSRNSSFSRAETPVYKRNILLGSLDIAEVSPVGKQL